MELPEFVVPQRNDEPVHGLLHFERVPPSIRAIIVHYAKRGIPVSMWALKRLQPLFNVETFAELGSSLLSRVMLGIHKGLSVDEVFSMLSSHLDKLEEQIYIEKITHELAFPVNFDNRRHFVHLGYSEPPVSRRIQEDFIVV